MTSLLHRSVLFASELVLAFGLVACGGGVNSPSPITAPPPEPRLTLSVNITGGGLVRSQPAAVSCTSNCAAQIEQNTVLTLTATPAAGQVFASWGDSCSGSDPVCVVTLTQSLIVSASFVPSAAQATYSLSLTVTGIGSVSSMPAGISCPGTCSASYAADTLVTLTAAAGANQSFTGWTGACSGAANICVVTMNQARSVVAGFAPVVGNSFSLNVSLSGNGSVVSSPVGINCGSTCQSTFSAGAVVNLLATPAAGQAFSSWTGSCTGSQPTCSLQMTQARSTQAVFTTIPVAAFGPAALLELNNDFDVQARLRVAVSPTGDALAVWEQSDGTPNGNTYKVYSRRYTPIAGWQAAQVVPGLSGGDFPRLVSGELLMDASGVATWIRANLETRRNSPTGGWTTLTPPPAIGGSNVLTSAVMDTAGNIGVLASGSGVFNNALSAGGSWGTWARLDASGNLVAERAKVSLSSNGSALAVWRESNPGDSFYSMKAGRYDPAAGSWSTPVSIETLFTNVEAEDPTVAIDSQGNGIAMWAQNSRLFYNLYKVGTGWQGAVQVDTDVSQILGTKSIQLAMTPDGRAVATWTVGLATLRSMQYNPATGWTAPETVDTYSISRDVFIDNSGQAVMVYIPFPNSNTKFDLVSRRLTLGGAWSAPSLLESGAGDVSNSRFVMNKTGQGVAAWVQNDVTSGVRNSLWSAELR